jgi:predicted Zn-dependent protease
MRYKFLVAVFLLIIFPVHTVALTVAEEKKYGREIFSEIAKSATINNDIFISFYIEEMKERLEVNASLPFSVQITVIESPAVDAFATIGGYVYVTTGLIALCDRNPELAGVLAHELAHIGRRHIAKRMEKQKTINITMLTALVLSLLVGDSTTKGAIVATGAASAQTMALKYSREDEEEADRFGAITAEKSGYGGRGVAGFLKKLKLTGTDTTLPQYLLTHPYHDERIARIERSYPETRVPDDTSIFPYLVVRAKILYGAEGLSPQDIWPNRHLKDRNDPLNGYGAALVYAKKGNIDEALEILSAMNSPFKKLFMGDTMVNARRFEEAITVLKNEPSPIGRFILARAYEGRGDLKDAAELLKGIVRYGDTYPAIYQRLGMDLGRMGSVPQGYEYLGKYYMRMGRYDLAKNHIEKAIAQYGVNSPEGRNLMGVLDEMQAATK